MASVTIVRTLLNAETGDVVSINSRVQMNVNHFYVLDKQPDGTWYLYSALRRDSCNIYGRESVLLETPSADWILHVCTSYISISIVSQVTVNCSQPWTRVVVCLTALSVSWGRLAFYRHRTRRHASRFIWFFIRFLLFLVLLLFWDTRSVENIGLCRRVVCSQFIPTSEVCCLSCVQ